MMTTENKQEHHECFFIERTLMQTSVLAIRTDLKTCQNFVDTGQAYWTEEAARHAIEVQKNYVKMLRMIKEKTEEYKKRKKHRGQYHSIVEDEHCFGVYGDTIVITPVPIPDTLVVPKLHRFPSIEIGQNIMGSVDMDAIKMFVLEGSGL